MISTTTARPPSIVRRFRREFSVAAALVVLLIVLGVFAPKFYQSQGRGKLWEILVDAAPIIVMAVGMTLVILTRHIDISIGWQYAICGMVAGTLAKDGWSLPVVLIAAILTGVVMGAINGFLVAGMNLPSIVVTLATMVIFHQSLIWITQGASVLGLPITFKWFGLGMAEGDMWIVAVAGATLVLFAGGLRWLAAGRAVYAVGSDQEAARLAGIHPPRVVWGVFTLMGLLCGLAAVLKCVRMDDVDTSLGKGVELQVIAAVVLGGVAISGGRGTVWGSLLGVLLLVMIRPALLFLEARPEWFNAVQGAVILAAVASDVFERRGRR